MSEGRWIGPLSVGGTWVGFRGLLTKAWVCKGKTEEWYSFRVMYWGYPRRHVCQHHEFGKPHLSPLLIYRLLDVSRWPLWMHQNHWVAPSTQCLGHKDWRRSLGAVVLQCFSSQRPSWSRSHHFMLTSGAHNSYSITPLLNWTGERRDN